ncbi:c-type cytochrome [Alcaligenes endophyticus]|uniref:C-type cytochrome n=1 Tax=Alcaligenes endophyticus TaxID=1929088 RepID=A0ABT8EJQ8_9BURK|nr:c-type cytochrome [Alcaligenes endophyticus]MCX5591788.1 c-type cytochrome [Alcaligenes endophyticus]MDN4121465.1 c-type cytochrome [Alcaligenes endophyticus]
MKLTHLLACIPLACLGFAAQAEEVDFAKVNEILKANACLACHTVDNKVVGPAYKDVAAKYKGDPANAELLAKHIREGSSGVWGPVPMPPQAHLSDENLKTVVSWIMAGAPN